LTIVRLWENELTVGVKATCLFYTGAVVGTDVEFACGTLWFLRISGLDYEYGFGEVAPCGNTGDALARVLIFLMGLHLGGFGDTDYGEIIATNPSVDILQVGFNLERVAGLADEAAECLYYDELRLAILYLLVDALECKSAVPGGDNIDSLGWDVKFLQSALYGRERTICGHVNPFTGSRSIAEDWLTLLPFVIEGLEYPSCFARATRTSYKVNFVLGENLVYKVGHLRTFLSVPSIY
jgi:hypothetical protein